MANIPTITYHPTIFRMPKQNFLLTAKTLTKLSPLLLPSPSPINPPSHPTNAFSIKQPEIKEPENQNTFISSQKTCKNNYPSTNMSRELPSPSNIHQIFLIASILATLAILAAICASCHRKPKKATPLGEKNASLEPKSKFEPQEAEKTELQGEIHGPIYSSAEMSKSKRRLSISSSMGLEVKLPKIKTGRREKRREEEDNNTLWKKTIIMGEKNKVPPWEEEEEEAMEKYGGDSYRRNYRQRSLPVSPIKWNGGDEVRSMEEV